MVCWRETNDKGKTESIADAKTRIEDLTVKIGDLTVVGVHPSTEIKNHEVEVAKNREALGEAAAIREKQLAEFNAEVKALRSAVTGLSKHSCGSLLQVPRSNALSIATMLQREMRRHASLLEGVFPSSERRADASLVQAP